VAVGSTTDASAPDLDPTLTVSRSLDLEVDQNA
jgi:hypothetical protein